MSPAPVAAARSVPAAATEHVRLIRGACYGPSSTAVAVTMQLTPLSTQTYAAYYVNQLVCGCFSCIDSWPVPPLWVRQCS